MVPENTGNFRPQRVLLVDDDQRLLDGLTGPLTAMGFHCIARSNASEAMLQFETGNFDLVITDLTMPSMDGLSVLGMIRSHSNVPIVILTGHPFEYGRTILGYENVTLIQKPIEAKALVARVRSLLGRKPNPQPELKIG
jgi:two-component system KDP operon response regulator KdpE